LYAQYLMRTASQSAKTSELYQKVMDGVARGALAPTVFQDILPGFVQARGADYAAKLADISTRFFSRMVEIDALYARDLMEQVLPGLSSAPVAPPQFDAADPIKWFQELSDYAGRLSTSALAAYQSLLEQVAAGQLAPNRLQEASSAYVEQRLPEHLRRLSGLYFDLLNGLNDLRGGYEEALLSAALASAREPNQDVPAALNLSGPLGGTTSASLLMTNTQEMPASIRCSVTDIRRADGVGPAFAPKITVAPEVLELRPGEEARVVLSLRLDEGNYEPDRLYIGAVHVARRGEPRVEVPLRITANAPEPAAPPAAARADAAPTPKRAGTKRRK
jgi:hypothetical protein